jgi:putative membrane protein
MALMMIAFLALAAWVIVTVVRHGSHAPAHTTANPANHAATRPTPQEILAERLARGEIEPEDYRTRLAALHDTPRT